jgi:hypothetical protein
VTARRVRTLPRHAGAHCLRPRGARRRARCWPVEQSVVLSDDPDVVRERATGTWRSTPGCRTTGTAGCARASRRRTFVRGGSDRSSRPSSWAARRRSSTASASTSTPAPTTCACRCSAPTPRACLWTTGPAGAGGVVAALTVHRSTGRAGPRPGGPGPS